MNKALWLVLCILFFCHAVQAQKLDSYGGLESIACAKSTGHFHVEKLGNQWWFCTPKGHGFFMEGVYAIVAATDKTLGPAVKSKYGDANGVGWADATLQRLKSWGFNSLGIYASTAILPTNSSPSARSLPIKLPFITVVRPALYSMRNPPIDLFHSKPRPLLNEPVKNMLYGVSQFYRGYRPSDGVADYYDHKMELWLKEDLEISQQFGSLKMSPYASYLIGIGEDDGDEMFGFGAGDAFPTMPPGHNNPHLSWLIATMSPVQTANARYRAVYSDTTVYTKKAWRDMLAAKYGSIEALDKAWGSNYTTFDSTGIPITKEEIGVGDGSTLSFRHALAHPVGSRFSVQVLVDQTPIAGDTGDEKLYGPILASGSINYATGQIAFDFAPGKAPRSGADISIDYVQNGWGIGSGLMDEDGRPSHRAWLGSDYVSLRDAKPAVRADLDAFLYSVTAQYLRTCHDEISKAFPSTLLLGPDSIGSWGAPARVPVLRAAAEYIDVLSGPGDLESRPASIRYIGEYFGDKPIIEGQYRTADADSPFTSHAIAVDNIHEFTSQQARGQAYYNNLASIRPLAYANGSHPFIGVSWWQYSDNRGEQRNWGLITLLDNAYDGHEDVKATVNCSPPLEEYRCGGEASDYGDVISLVRKANLLWINASSR